MKKNEATIDWKAEERAGSPSVKNLLENLNSRKVIPYLFIMPNVIAFIIFFLLPLLLGVYYSFTNYDGFFKAEFVGLANYMKIFNDANFWRVLTQTSKYVFIVVPLIYIVSMGLALMVTRRFKGTALMRSLFYWPVMVSAVIVGLIWRWIFGESFGIINYVLNNLGSSGVPWLTNQFFAFTVILIATVWSRAGFYMVILMGGIQGISDSYYEAAEVDGASKIQKFFMITLPLLKPTTVLVILLSTIESFKVYPLIVSLTGGGPNRSTTLMVQNIYQSGFEKFEVGYSSAMSMIFFLILLIFSAVQFKITKGGRVDD